ncbi:Uncharacterised protein [Bergeriella denitrificans]|uniref:Uncharacterized protein n=1 Tax=Bergeriella denitrificans TaxID=494 RepID=A0A378ULG3_BERDE|nr:hypothetical protein [Bergeriella denitrificans]STZ77509.1 Uncharacterised protein [Bergeriella denitrificans]
MKLRCPACGAAMSLEVLIAHDDAREALIALTGISDELTRAMLKYLTLFRPSEKDLSFARVAKLLGELLPMIRAGEISRGRKAYPAPREAWIWAAGRCLEARDKGRLTPPLSSHGFLLENITFWQQQAPAPTLSRHDGGGSGGGARNSKLRQGAAALLEWAGNDWLRLEIAQGLTMLSAQNMKGRPAAADMAVVGEMGAAARRARSME